MLCPAHSAVMSRPGARFSKLSKNFLIISYCTKLKKFLSRDQEQALWLDAENDAKINNKT